jgi:hypothetical protein
MHEKIFQGELKKSIEAEGGLCYKFPDMILTQNTRFIPEKPADLIAVVNNKPILIECKMIKEIKNIRPNFFGNTKEKKEKVHWSEYRQVKELFKFYKNGNDAYYAINLRVSRKINQLILIHIEMFLSYFLSNDMITKEKLIELGRQGIEGSKGLFTGITKKI